MDGYAGNIAYADLSAGTVTIKPTPPELKKQYIGGWGFGIRLLTDMVDPKIDPLGENNTLMFAAGPLTGTGIPLGSWYEVSTISPLAGTAVSGNSGGSLAGKTLFLPEQVKRSNTKMTNNEENALYHACQREQRQLCCYRGRERLAPDRCRLERKRMPPADGTGRY